MVNTYFSNRIYKNTLSPTTVELITNDLLLFNKAKHYAYKQLWLQQHKGLILKNSLHMLIKNEFKVNDYYANSIIQLANGLIDSQRKLNKQYINDLENKINKRKKKIKTLKRLLTIQTKIHKSLIEGNIKLPKTKDYLLLENGSVLVVFQNKAYNLYDFEHLFLIPNIKDLKNQIKQIERSISLLEIKLSKLKEGFKGVCFGSKKLFKTQYTVDKYKNNHDLWKNEFQHSRNNSLQISGRLDAKYGNFVFKYDYTTQNLNYTTIDGTLLTIENLLFKYGQDKLNYALINQKTLRKPITWTIEDHGDYYIFKVTVDTYSNNYINHSTVDGVIGIDINYDHIAWSETNKSGQLLSFGVIPYNLEGKTTGQAIKIIEEVAKQLVDIATSKHKPIVREDLNLDRHKSSMQYDNKTKNRKISQFAYDKIISSIESRAFKEGVAVFKVNPAYSSQIGKIKYMKQKGISIHIAASYVIARRGLGFKESVPPVLRNLLPEKIVNAHHWVHWNYLSKLVKGVKTNAFYKIPSFQSYCSESDYVNVLKTFT